MNQIIISLLIAFCVSSPSLGGDVPKRLPADELAWFYTLAVQKESDNFSFSLMKEGWLAFDTWSDGEEIKEERIEISEDQYAKLKVSFENLFQNVQRTENRVSVADSEQDDAEKEAEWTLRENHQDAPTTPTNKTA